MSTFDGSSCDYTFESDTVAVDVRYDNGREWGANSWHVYVKSARKPVTRYLRSYTTEKQARTYAARKFKEFQAAAAA
jgi:hypothetical protein